MVSWLRANKQSSSLSYMPLARRPRQRHEKWFQKLLKNHPTSVQKMSKIGPKLGQNRYKMGVKLLLGARGGKMEPTAPKNWSPGPKKLVHLEAKLGWGWGHVGRKLDFWRSWMAIKNEHEFWNVSEPIWGRFWSDLEVQNGPQIVPKSASRAIMEKMQKC